MAAEVEIIVGRIARTDRYLDATNMWPTFATAAWVWLWNHRADSLFRVSVLGITLLKKRFGDLYGVWVRAFGPPPFDWQLGPLAQTAHGL